MKVRNLIIASLLLGYTTAGFAQLSYGWEEAAKRTQEFTYEKNKKQRQPGGAKSNGIKGPTKRPDHLNNSLLKYFPPIFNQDHGSCDAASYIGYQWTYERNCYYGLDAQYPENRFTSHFNFLLAHNYQGTGKADMLQNVGNPSEADYGGQTCSKYFGSQDCKDPNYGWMQGYDKWYRTAHNRDWTDAYLEQNVMTEEGREILKGWLWNHNGDYDFNAGGVAWFGMAATDYVTGTIPDTPTNKALGLVGKIYMEVWGPSYNHAQTIVGYDDRIEFDLDHNGVYGEKDKDEVGAWIIANSWGNGWQNNGFIYCPYACAYTTNTCSSPWSVDRHYIRKDYEPIRMLKAKIAFSRRSALHLSVSATQDTASASGQDSLELDHFKFAGDGTRTTYMPPEVPMLGKWIDGYHYEPMEFGYDLSDLTKKFDRRKPIKYFFNIRTQRNLAENWQGTGRLYNASIIDYELDQAGIEFPFKFEKIDIGGTDQLYRISVIIPGEQINPPINLALNDGTLSWEQPATTSLPISKYYIYNDDRVIDSVAANTLSYTPGDKANDKAYGIAAVYKYRQNSVVSEQSNRVIFPVESTGTDNVVLEMKQTLATVTNVGFKASLGGTLEYWIKPYTVDDYTQQFGNTAYFYSSFTYNGNVKAGLGANSAYNAYNCEVEPNKWTHIAIVRDGDQLYAYINGLKKSISVYSKPAGVLAFSDFSIGRDPNDGLINGQIDEVRLWNRALSETELKNNRRTEIVNPGQQTDLVLYYKGDTFEDSDGQLVIRDYARGHHAVIRDPENAKTLVDNSIFRNGSSDLSVTVNDPTETLYTNTPVKFTAAIPACATKVKWIIDTDESKAVYQTSPYLTFDKAGNHIVKVIIEYEGGKTLASNMKIVKVQELPAPVADFEVTQDNLPASEYFSFVNRSSAVNATYQWSMPGADVEQVRATNASARFLQVGSYPVTLTVTNAAGTATVTKEVTAIASAPYVDFDVSPSAILIGDKVFFEDKTIYDPEEWQWEINHVSGKRNYAIHAQNTAFTPLAPGYYNVTLKARNPQGQTGKTQRKIFAVSNADPGNALTFYADGEYVDIPTPFPASTRSFTIDSWLRPADFNGVLTFSTEDGKFCTRSNADGSLTVEIAGKSVTSDPGYFILDEWHHYAVTFNTGNVKFYRDAEQFSAPTLRLALNCPAWTGTLKFSSPDTRYKGLIDEMRIWSKALNQKTIQAFSNQPIATDDIEAAKSSNGLLLYYDFNQNGGDIIDRTGLGHTGARCDFSGADGDAWTSALGVFTLDFEGDEPSDVSADYLTNYKAPFLDNGTSVSTSNSTNLLGLLTGTDDSKWVIEGSVVSEKSTTGAHVYKTLNSDINFRTGYYGFADTLKNHRLYQTITLPAGYYTLNVRPSNDGAWVADSSLLCVVRGDEFVDMLNYEEKSEAFVPLSDGTVNFTVGEEEDITIGLIINLTGWNAIDVNEFQLMRTPVLEVEPDEETSIYDAVDNGSIPRYTPMANAIRVVNSEMRPMLVYTLDGRLVFNEMVEGVHIIPFAPGIYIIDGEKIQVK
ncbi:MAG: PKD domain-containing protein [Bacteroidaceae bacterium]|nr:PKD domain-containing protein [Bacteroidaceae bacterium]